MRLALNDLGAIEVLSWEQRHLEQMTVSTSESMDPYGVVTTRA